jgi:hypothetical protein
MLLEERLCKRWDQLPAGLVPEPLQFEFGDGSALHLVRQQATIQVIEGAHAAPALRIRVDRRTTLEGLLAGHDDVLSAFMARRVQADGFIVSAVTFLNVFAGRTEPE